MRTSWNNTVASAVRSVGQVEWEAVGKTIIAEGQALTRRVAGSTAVQEAKAATQAKVAEVEEKAEKLAERVKQDKREDVRIVEEIKPELQKRLV